MGHLHCDFDSDSDNQIMDIDSYIEACLVRIFPLVNYKLFDELHINFHEQMAGARAAPCLHLLPRPGCQSTKFFDKKIQALGK